MSKPWDGWVTEVCRGLRGQQTHPSVLCSVDATATEVERLLRAARNETGQLVPSRIALFIKALAWRELPAGVDRAAVVQELRRWR